MNPKKVNKSYPQTDSTSSNVYTTRLNSTCKLDTACYFPCEEGRVPDFLRAVKNMTVSYRIDFCYKLNDKIMKC